MKISMGKFVTGGVIGVAIALTLLAVHSRAVQAQQPDITPPQLTIPGGITVEATSRLGVAVTFRTTATDAADPNPVVICNPPSDTVFPLGTTTVICTATDAAGNASRSSFSVTVRDITPPVLTLPASIETEGSTEMGARVIFIAEGSDTVDPGPSVVCKPPSGAFFPLGTTLTSCTATDASGNLINGSFAVTVVDSTPPVLTMPVDITAEATSRLGAVVTFAPGATDVVDPDVSVECNPVSGSVFQLGATSVGCTASDAAGNIITGSFSVTIRDTSPPSVTGRASPGPNANGWNNTDVAVTFQCTDPGSGVLNCAGDVTLTEEGAAQRVEGIATDLAGNIATTSLSINLDKTAPTVTIATPAEGDGFLILADVPAVWLAVDALSGVASESGTVESGAAIDTSSLGLKSFTVTAKDLAGNLVSATHSYVILSHFAVFAIKEAQLGLQGGVPSDEFQIEGIFQLGAYSNGMDVANEEVTVTFDGFSQTMPAGSFFRDDEGVGLRFDGPAGGVTRIDIRDDGIFLVRAEKLDLPNIVSGVPVAFSLQIGDDVGRVAILLGESGSFRLERRQARDLFGTVMAIGEGILTVKTDRGVVELVVTEDSDVRLPRKMDATIADLVVGDVVAVSLEEKGGKLVPDKIVLVPGKTRNKHVPGEVVAVTSTHITVRPAGPADEPITFSRSLATGVRFHHGETELTVGSFVVIAAVRDPVTGSVSPEALEINVVPKRSVSRQQRGPKETSGAELGNRAEIRGVFEGIDESGNWIINGIPVAFGPETQLKDSLAVGRIVEIEADLNPDGSFLAREVESSDRVPDVVGMADLTGTFDGVDVATGSWIIGGTSVTVGPSTDSDGLPVVGQRVKVRAVFQEDGSLLAREIENIGQSSDPERDPFKMKLSGTFQGIDDQGNWIVDSAKVAVGSLTMVEGTPAVGQLVEVKAIAREDGSLLARKIRGEKRDGIRSRREAQVRGTIEGIHRDGSLVIDGIRIALSTLTELEGEPQAGDLAEVQALIQEDGSLLAVEVKIQGKAGIEDFPEASQVNIQGTIAQVNLDGSLIVNGIPITVRPLTETKGKLTQGSLVKLEGLLQPDGSILARQIRGEGRRATVSETEVKIVGVVTTIIPNVAGNIVAVVVDGLTIGLGPLSRREARLELGSQIEINAVIADGRLLASSIKGVSIRKPSEEEFAMEVEGVIDAIQIGDQGQITGISINGLVVVVGDFTELGGPMAAGDTVDIKGDVKGGALRAEKVIGESDNLERPRRREFEVQGVVRSVIRDVDGEIVGLFVDGSPIAIKTLTRVQGILEQGAFVKVEGIVFRGELLASEVKRKGN